MQKSSSSEIRRNKILAFISFGVIVYCVIGLFSNDPANGTYVGSIILGSIMFFISFVSIGFLKLNNKFNVEINILNRSKLNSRFQNP